MVHLTIINVNNQEAPLSVERKDSVSEQVYPYIHVYTFSLHRTSKHPDFE